MVDIKEILNKTEEKLIADNTDTPITSDFNNCVDATAIALRELMIYGDFPEKTKESMQLILSVYGMLFENDLYNGMLFKNDLYNFDKAIKCAEELIPDINWTEGVKFMIHPLCIDKTKIFEVIIREILLTYWQDYTIPTSNYEDIEYMHVNAEVHPCNTLKHHYRCLHDKSLDWNELEKKYKYELCVTGKEIKEMALNARDSGGNLDYSGHAHIGTTMNVINCFMANKLDLPYEWQYRMPYANDEELEQISKEIYEEVCLVMSDYMITLY